MLIHKIILRVTAVLVVSFWTLGFLGFGWIVAEGPVWWVVLPVVILSIAMALGFFLLHNFGRLAFLVLWGFLTVVAVEQWWQAACCDGIGPLSSYYLGQLFQALGEWPLYLLVFSIYLFHPSTTRVFRGSPRFSIGRSIPGRHDE